LSDTSYSLKISFDSNATLDYCTEYSDYMYLNEETSRDVSMDGMSGDGVFELSEFIKFKFHGYIEIGLEEGMDVEEIKLHSRYLGAEANPITAELEINNAEIVDD